MPSFSKYTLHLEYQLTSLILKFSNDDELSIFQGLIVPLFPVMYALVQTIILQCV